MTPWVLRNEFDQTVKADVYDANEYGVPDDMTGECVLDIGACFGAFTRLCAERSAYVVAYEPDPESRDLLVRNTAHVAHRVHVIGAAVLDRTGPALLSRTADPAGRTIYCGDGVEVRCVHIDTAIREALVFAGATTVDLLKIDAEGAEYAIVEASEFKAVKALTIEFHGNYVRPWKDRAEACRKRLADLGFREVAWDETHVGTGWYRLYKGERI